MTVDQNELSEDQNELSEDERQEALGNARQLLAEIQATDQPDLMTLLGLVDLGLVLERLLCPPQIHHAVIAVWQTEGSIANGGVDQCVWNMGTQNALQIAQSFRAVGAIENASLFERLANELALFRHEKGAEAIEADLVSNFLTWRKKVQGPFFNVPSVKAEVGQAVETYAAVHKQDFALPDSLDDAT